MTVDTDILALAALIAVVAAVSQSVSGFGFALVMVPLLSLVWDVKQTVVATTILSTLNLLPLVLRMRDDVSMRRLLPMLGGTIGGIPIGIYVLARLASNALQALIGVVVILATVFVFFSPGFKPPSPDRLAPVVTGFIAGILRGATSMAGPPASLYLITTEREPAVIRATMTWFLLPQGILTVAALLAAGRVDRGVLEVTLVCLPAIAFGLVLGGLVVRRVETRLFRSITFGLLISTALLAILSATGVT